MIVLWILLAIVIVFVGAVGYCTCAIAGKADRDYFALVSQQAEDDGSNPL